MRLLVCVTLLFVCLATLPSVHCQNRKFKLAEYDEKDRRDTKERYKPKYRGRNEDDEIGEQHAKKKELKHQSDEDEGQYNRPARKYKKDDEAQRGNKNSEEIIKHTTGRNRVSARKLQETDEDDDTNEDNDSEVCIKKKGGKCESTEHDSTEETDESDEEVPVKRATYVKKYGHEKKKTHQDREMANILKIHKKSGLDLDNKRKSRDDEDSSEEVTVRRRGRFIYADDDE